MKIKHVKIVDFAMEMLCVITVLSYLTMMLQVNVSEKKTDPSNWLPRTEAQMLDDEVCRRSSSLSGNIDTGYVYTSGSQELDEPIKLSGSLGLKSTKRKEYNKMYKSPKERAFVRIKKVIFNNPATIVFWADGTKTVVKCGKEDTFDPEKGLAMAISKYFFNNAGWFNDVFKKYLPEETEEK
jgi:hypothetical protein